jgi:hypothetical protein
MGGAQPWRHGRNEAGHSRRVARPTKAASSGRWWGDQAQLYKYNGNLLQLCAFARLNVPPAAEMSAGGKFLSACRD